MLAHQVPPPSRLIISMWMFVVGCVWECEWICARSNNIISLSRVSMALRFSGPWEVGQTYLRRKPGLNTTWFIHIEHGFFVGPGRTFVSIVISKSKGRIWLVDKTVDPRTCCTCVNYFKKRVIKLDSVSSAEYTSLGCFFYLFFFMRI